jgi:hypothetical protein
MWPFLVVSQKPNYEIYHGYINKAEEQFFVENKADSSLYFYKKAFSEFDFVFVKDPLNAAQIAYYSHLPYEEFLVKGFENGLKFSHLASIKLFSPIYGDLLNNKSLQNKYAICRKKYIQRLDLSYLSYLYKKGILDQIDKNKDNYDEIKLMGMEQWLKIIQLKGFPGDKIIGIDDKNIFHETGNPGNDIDQVKIKYSNKLSYYTADEEILSSHYMMIILVHKWCAFNDLKTIFEELIRKGEIHPREVGLLYDNMFRNNDAAAPYRCQPPSSTEGLFYLNLFCPYKQLACSEKQSDLLRQKWFIVPLSIDKIKMEYEQKFGFRMFYGFWNCL